MLTFFDEPQYMVFKGTIRGFGGFRSHLYRNCRSFRNLRLGGKVHSHKLFYHGSRRKFALSSPVVTKDLWFDHQS